jgi:hypothetical protein
MNAGSGPQLAVVICTLGEGAAGEAVASIAASAESAGLEPEIVVVWQGAAPAPEFPPASMIDVFPVGLSHARNRGLNATRAPLVAFVDDDELVDPGWAKGLLDGFAREESPSGVFGPVEPLDDRGLPYCAYAPGEPRLFQGRKTPPWIVGTGGNMAFRRDVLVPLGGFDLHFGIGAAAHSAEESDLVLRLLADGHAVAWSPEMVVYHPTKTEHEHLVSRYPYGFGMGSVLRHHHAAAHAARYVVTIGESLSIGLRKRDARRRRESLATLRSFLAGSARRLRPVVPRRALERLPADLRAELDGAQPEPLEGEFGERPHFRYRVGRERLLHLHVNPDADFVASLASTEGVLAYAPDRDAVWVLERVS